MRNSVSWLQKILTSFLTLLLVIPPIQAEPLFGSLDLAGANFGPLTHPVWETVAQKILDSDPLGGKSESELKEIQRGLFADYLSYLNSIGIELASYEATLLREGEEGERDRSCLDSDEVRENDLIKSSLKSDVHTFTQTYCSAPCRKMKATGFQLIATYDPVGSVSCEKQARQIFEDFNCEGKANDPSSLYNSFEGIGNGRNLSIGLGNNVPKLRIPYPKLPSSQHFIELGLEDNLQNLSGGDPFLFSSQPNINYQPGTFVGIDNPEKILPYQVPAYSVPENSPPAIDAEILGLARAKKTQCQKKTSQSLYTTFQNPADASPNSTSNLSHPNNFGPNPLWTTYDPEPANHSTDEDYFITKIPDLCGNYKPDHFSKLRSKYMVISHDAILSQLGHWPILDEEGKVEDKYIVEIKQISDALFIKLIERLENSYIQNCSSRFDLDKIAMFGEGHAVITGAKVVNPGKEVPSDKKVDEEKEKKDDDQSKGGYQVETVAQYFSHSAEPIESFVDGLLTADRLGSASPVEHRASSLAAEVRDGRLKYEDIGAAAKNGPYGYRAEDIEKMTRGYLEQNDLAGILNLAAEIAGGVSGGVLVNGGVSAARRLGGVDLSGVNLSRLFLSIRDFIRKPLLEGVETGAVNFWDSAKKWNVPAKDISRVSNGANHIFGSGSLAKHNLKGFLEKFAGDSVGAFKSLESAAQALADSGKIQGVFKEVVVTVKGVDVTIRGNVIDGIAKLSTAFIP